MSSRRLTRIDELHLADFAYLRADDDCYYLGEYTVSAGYAFSPTNDLIINLKKGPEYRGTAAWKYKLRAVRECARAFLGAVGHEWLSSVTLVPMPPSKVQADREYDDRMFQVLKALDKSAPVHCDVRELITQSRSYDPSHSGVDRMGPAELRQIYRLAPELLEPPPTHVAVVDDVIDNWGSLQGSEGAAPATMARCCCERALCGAGCMARRCRFGDSVKDRMSVVG